MELTQQFVVGLPVGDAFAVLTDLERIAPSMPGAQLDEIEGDEYRGRVRVKVGPVTLEYRGTARIVERGADQRSVNLVASGREAKGNGNAQATVTARLSEDEPGRTTVSVETVLDISGRAAQFGRAAIADVSSKLVGQFVENLERDLASRADGDESGGSDNPPVDANGTSTAPAGERTSELARSVTAADATPQPADGVRRIEQAPAEPVRLVGLVGPALVKRLAPIAVFAVLGALLRRRFRHRRASK